MTELEVVAKQIRDASCYTQIFGKPPDGVSAKDHVNRVYRRLARVVHPDRCADASDRTIAAQTLAKLSTFKADAKKALADNRFGEPVKLATITSRKGTHAIVRTIGNGDITAAYMTDSTIGGLSVQGFCKIAKRAADNDLMANEAAALKRLHADSAEDKWKRHVPRLVDTFVYDKTRCRANVIELLDGFYSLKQLLEIYPMGIDPRHGVWMFRRLLMALGFAHDNGVVHAAVVPSHVMVHPANHGIVLADWCYASLGDNDAQPTIKAIVGTYKGYYPEEVFDKTPPSPATDISMAVRCIIAILGGNPETGSLPDRVPRPIRSYLKGCLQTKQSMRPQNAWLLLEEFDELLKRMGAPYYPRRFIEFTVPTGTV